MLKNIIFDINIKSNVTYGKNTAYSLFVNCRENKITLFL